MGYRTVYDCGVKCLCTALIDDIILGLFWDLYVSGDSNIYTIDPGWMHISSDTQQVSNASGIAGAWIADLLFGF